MNFRGRVCDQRRQHCCRLSHILRAYPAAGQPGVLDPSGHCMVISQQRRPSPMTSEAAMIIFEEKTLLPYDSSSSFARCHMPPPRARCPRGSFFYADDLRRQQRGPDIGIRYPPSNTSQRAPSREETWEAGRWGAGGGGKRHRDLSIALYSVFGNWWKPTEASGKQKRLRRRQKKADT